MFQFGWKKILKVDKPVDIFFKSINWGKNEFISLKFSNISLAIEYKDCPQKKINNNGGKVNNILFEKVASKSRSKKIKKTSNWII